MSVMTENQLLDESKAASLIGMSVAFLRRGRHEGIVGGRTPAPPHLKLGRAVRYLRSDLDAWLAARRVDPVKRKAAANPHAA
jgi:predicted DNA-binding transcriptional regulator AlpA